MVKPLLRLRAGRSRCSCGPIPCEPHPGNWSMRSCRTATSLPRLTGIRRRTGLAVKMETVDWVATGLIRPANLLPSKKTRPGPAAEAVMCWYAIITPFWVSGFMIKIKILSPVCFPRAGPQCKFLDANSTWNTKIWLFNYSAYLLNGYS